LGLNLASLGVVVAVGGLQVTHDYDPMQQAAETVYVLEERGYRQEVK
jgi:hypothetical protein